MAPLLSTAPFLSFLELQRGKEGVLIEKTEGSRYTLSTLACWLSRGEGREHFNGGNRKERRRGGEASLSFLFCGGLVAGEGLVSQKMVVIDAGLRRKGKSMWVLDASSRLCSERTVLYRRRHHHRHYKRGAGFCLLIIVILLVVLVRNNKRLSEASGSGVGGAVRGTEGRTPQWPRQTRAWRPCRSRPWNATCRLRSIGTERPSSQVGDVFFVRLTATLRHVM